MTDTSFGGPWTLEKLDILGRYLDSYTTALRNRPFNLIYVDAFAGEGSFRLNTQFYQDDYDDFREFHAGSARRALGITDKPFDRFVFSDTNPQRHEALLNLRHEFPDRDIAVSNEDANIMLPQFCESLRPLDRAVVFLDPFATAVSWSTIMSIARTEKIDCWILFPVGAISRMMPRHDEPSEALASQLDRIFGSREHWADFYHPSPQLSLFVSDPNLERNSESQQIADRYRERLTEVFLRVAETRRTFRNSRNSAMFELFFGATNSEGAAIAIRIADHILSHW